MGSWASRRSAAATPARSAWLETAKRSPSSRGVAFEALGRFAGARRSECLAIAGLGLLLEPVGPSAPAVRLVDRRPPGGRHLPGILDGPILPALRLGQ